MRGSGNGAPSARSRDARKSINSCFSAGERPAAADSISARVTIRTSVHRVESHAKAIERRPAPGTRVLFGDLRVRLPAASREVPRASDFESPPRETSRFPDDNRGCSRSYSGSFLRKVAHRLASSRTDQHARVEKQPHGCSRGRRMSASSSAIQPEMADAPSRWISHLCGTAGRRGVVRRRASFGPPCPGCAQGPSFAEPRGRAAVTCPSGSGDSRSDQSLALG